MDTSENKKRVLDLLWRHFDDAVMTIRRFQDRATVVVAATTASIGLLLNPTQNALPAGECAFYAAIVCLLLYVISFAAATYLWLPRQSQRPGKLDVGHIWEDLIKVDDDVSAANLMQDLCKATVAERKVSGIYSRWLVGCMLSSAGSVVAACVYAVLR